MKKILEHLKTLPSPYREMAIENYLNQGSPLADDSMVLSPRIAVLIGFGWGLTPEGDNFWHAIYLDALHHEQNNIPIP